MEKRIVLIGNFDGLHIGHQKLISKAKKIAYEKNAKVVGVTFNPHPREVLLNEKIDLILPYSEKKKLMFEYGVDIVDEIKFDKDISEFSPEKFIMDKIINLHNPSDIIVGNNFRFGAKAKGNPDFLKSFLNDKVAIHNEDIIEKDDESVSSSLIKNYLKSGDVEKVNLLIGRKYHLFGTVVKGEQRGREIGYPTTNLKTSWNYLPKGGVYVTRVKIKNEYHESITNIGVRPTFGKSSLQIESHIFNFNEDVYGEEIIIDFLKRIRDEKKFETIEKLIENISQDVKYAKNFFEVNK